MRKLLNLAILTSFFISVESSALSSDQLVLEQSGDLSYEKSFDFGTVPQGAVVTHEFQITNSGKSKVVIQKVTASCGCTAASIANNVLEAGESVKLKVDFDTAGFSGQKTKTVDVVAAGSEVTDLTLALRGTVLPGVVAEPQRIEFGELAVGSYPEGWSKEFSVTVKEGSQLAVGKVQSFNKHLTIENVGEAGGVKTYRLVLSEEVPRGEFRDRVVVEFTGGRQQAINIPILASIKGDLRILPSTISFGVIDGTKLLERRVRFENYSRSPVNIKEIKTSEEAVSANFVEIEVGKKGVLVVTVDPSKVTRDLRATVEITTDHPKESELSINVFGVIPSK